MLPSADLEDEEGIVLKSPEIHGIGKPRRDLWIDRSGGDPSNNLTDIEVLYQSDR